MAPQMIASWLLAAMELLAPPERLAALPQWPGQEETATEKRARYASIAEDLAAVAFDPAEPPVYDGAHGRKRTAALLLGIAYLESGFARDVDRGPCYRGKGAPGRCDGGRSACVLQLHVGAGTTREGWTQADVFADRRKCFRAGLDLVRRSFKACAKLGELAGLNAYAAWTCESLTGAAAGKKRLVMGRRVFELAGRPGEADGAFLSPTSPHARSAP